MNAEAVVDLDAIAENTELISSAAGAAVMAVVKADGFGHGMVPVARTALAHGASWLGVATTAEALQLRGAGITAPVLSWLHGPDEDFRPAILANVDLVARRIRGGSLVGAYWSTSSTICLVDGTEWARNR
ncbi:alanine racemase [Saccharopolyspora sp. 5N708]|uniref:alanine racemase n=1 Tax=Saccharopolyspora sp. 5N708 TaxID=3457424 RepID=UPI003FD1268C